MSPCKQNHSYNHAQNYNKIYRLAQRRAQGPHQYQCDYDQSQLSQQPFKATSSNTLVRNNNNHSSSSDNNNKSHSNRSSSIYYSSSYDDISHIINSSSSSSGGHLATELVDHHRKSFISSVVNQHNQLINGLVDQKQQQQPHGQSSLGLFLMQEQTAGAMVGVVRLMLVILICVLLAKLRSPKLNNSNTNRASKTRRAGRQDELDDHYNESHRETKISEMAASGAGVCGYKQSDSNDNLGKYLNVTNKQQQQHRRYSQPILPSVPSQLADTKQATAAPTNSNWQQQADNANERRRRHSDTAISSLQLPPGPTGLPFLGYLPFLGPEIHLTLTELSRKFGPIYQIFLGGIRVVVLNDASLVRQAFKQAVFSGRPDTQLTRILQGYGIVNSEGALWKEQRAFLHSALRKLGAKSLMSGTNGLEAKIQNQVKDFVNDLSVHAEEGRPCQVRPIVARAVSSVVGSIVMNLTYRKYEEKEKFDRVIELMQEGFRLFSIAMPLDFIPIFRFLPGVGYAYKKMKRNRAETSAFFQDVADEHRKYLSKTFNLGVTNSTGSLHPKTAGVVVEQPPTAATSNLCETPPTGADKTKHVELDKIVARDLVDAYIVQQKKHEKDGKENYFSDQQLVQIMSDIFSAGLETVTSTIEWSILFLILNVHCQDKIQQEIDRIIGRDRAPQLEDLAQMPYTEATIYEVLRRSNVVALGNAHATLADATIAGYRIPKGTQVLPNLYGIHMDPKLWLEPDQFNPARFIVNDRAQKPEYFIPFSTGRRMCLGDVLAKMEVFLFLVGLLQKYDLSVHQDDRDSPPQVKGTIGVSNAPVSFRVALNLRDKTSGQVKNT